jgi:hypothetical protein
MVSSEFHGPVSKALQDLWKAKSKASKAEDVSGLLWKFYSALHLNVKDKNWDSASIDSVMQDSAEFLELLLGTLIDERAVDIANSVDNKCLDFVTEVFTETKEICAG